MSIDGDTGVFDDDGLTDYQAWQNELDGHRPHAWMLLLMCLNDVCLLQGKEEGRERPLPAKVDAYLLYGLAEQKSKYRQNIDQPTSWLRSRIQKKSLFLGMAPKNTGDEVGRCVWLVDAAVQRLALVWSRLSRVSWKFANAVRVDGIDGGASVSEKAAAMLAMRDDAEFVSAVESLAPGTIPTWRALGGVEPSLVPRLQASCLRVMQLAAISRVIGSPMRAHQLLALLDERGYAEELERDFPEVAYLSFAGLDADFGMEASLRLADESGAEEGGRIASSLVCFLATLSLVGPVRLAEYGRAARPAVPPALARFFQVMDRANGQPASTTLIPSVERRDGAAQQALTLTQVTYECYEGPMDARGPVIAIHRPINLERNKVYYLGREVTSANFLEEDERKAFERDQAEDRAVVVRILPVTKTGVGRVHAKIYYDSQTRLWMLYGLRNRTSSEHVSARTLVIDPNDQILSVTLARDSRTGKVIDHTTWNSRERGSSPLRRSTILWLASKMVVAPDGSVRWEPDDVRGAVFVVGKG